MKYRILGRFDVRSDGATVELGSPKERALFADLLVHHGTAVSTDRLIEDIWGEDAPRTAAHSVQTYVSGLRKALDPTDARIVTEPHGYRLDVTPDDIDARRFEQRAEEGAIHLAAGAFNDAVAALESALALWRGPPLPEFAYAEFAQGEIRHLEELHASVVDDLAEAYLALGDTRGAARLARESVAADRLRERSRALLMRALAANGRHAEALQVYSSYRHRLVEDLGIDPSPDLARLEQRILMQDPEIYRPAARAQASGTEPGVENPYRGLRPFAESDAPRFFGRVHLTEELGGAVRDRPLTAVVGPSGCGKSSVVGAGLLPAVRQWPGWEVAVMLPGRHPFLEADAALAKIEPETDLMAMLDSAPDGLLRSAIRALPAPDATLLLIIDQFEELFTLTPPDERERFLAALAYAIDDPRRRLRVLLAVRADFYDHLLRAPGLGEALVAGVINVPPLSAVDLEAAASAPAAAVGVEAEPELVAELVSDTVGRPGALPLFQDVLTSLFEHRTEGMMTLEAYENLGRLGGALEKRSEQVFSALERDAGEITRQVFLHLVVPQADARPTRRRAPLGEIASIGDGAGDATTVVDAFVETRLLTLDRDASTGEATVEIAHETLLDAWGRLSMWVDAAEEDVRNHDALLLASRLWREAGEDADYLWKGARLAHYELWAAESGFSMARPARDFLDASTAARDAAEAEESARREREARLAKRARTRMWALAVAVVVIAAVGTFAVLTYMALPQSPDVALIYEGEGDSGWNDMIIDGTKAAAADLDLDVRTFATAAFEVHDEIVRASESGAPLVLVPSSAAAADLDIIAPQFPDTSYLLVDTPGLQPNVRYVLFAQHHGSFLVGAAAAMKSETGVVGFVGGSEWPGQWLFENGFVAGVAAVDPDIEVLTTYLTPCWDSGGWVSLVLAYEAAMEMYDQGADVVYHTAGGAGYGVLEAAEDASEATGVHRWAIGVDTDEYDTSPRYETEAEPDVMDPAAWPDHILTSMIKRIDLVVEAAIRDFESGTFTPGQQFVGLENGYVAYSTSGGYINDIVPELERLKAQIIAGEILVPDWREDQIALVRAGEFPCDRALGIPTG